MPSAEQPNLHSALPNDSAESHWLLGLPDQGFKSAGGATTFGQIVVQAGVVNAYDRRNMFYYDLFTGRRLNQLPLAPPVLTAVAFS